jgi:hypothetical protein
MEKPFHGKALARVSKSRAGGREVCARIQFWLLLKGCW